MYLFKWPAWVHKLIPFAAGCNVHFPLADRKGLHVTAMLSLYTPCCI